MIHGLVSEKRIESGAATAGSEQLRVTQTLEEIPEENYGSGSTSSYEDPRTEGDGGNAGTGLPLAHEVPSGRAIIRGQVSFSWTISSFHTYVYFLSEKKQDELPYDYERIRQSSPPMMSACLGLGRVRPRFLTRRFLSCYVARRCLHEASLASHEERRYCRLLAGARVVLVEDALLPGSVRGFVPL